MNDAPALQHADVAVAMGSGTAVAKGASDLVLGDDSFATLLYAIREGRRIVDNVQKGLVFLISTHVALLGFILIATLVGFGQPLLPLQILWLELFIDLSTSVAFEREPEEPGIMRRAPRDREVPLLTTPLLGKITAAGSFSLVGALALMSWHPGGFEHARWLAFTALVVAQAVRAYANRSLTLPLQRPATQHVPGDGVRARDRDPGADPRGPRAVGGLPRDPARRARLGARPDDRARPGAACLGRPRQAPRDRLGRLSRRPRLSPSSAGAGTPSSRGPRSTAP